MLKIDNSLLQEIGLGALPDAEKNSLLKHIYETLEMRVGIRLADQMTNQQLDEFEQYFEAKDDAGAFKWLETNFPNYKDIVQEEFDKLKAEVAQSAPQILAASQQTAQMPSGAPAGQPGMQAQAPAGLGQGYAQAPADPQLGQQQPAQNQTYDQASYQGAQPQAGPAPAQPYAAPQPTHPQQPPAPAQQPYADPGQQPPQPYQPQYPPQQPPAGPQQ